MISIRLFGHLEIQAAGATLGTREFRGRKPRQVLAILALARGNAVSKTVLADHLWQGNPPATWPSTLESYVAVLRRALQPDPTDRRLLVQTTPGGYRLDHHRAEVDLDTFDRLVAEAVTSPPGTALPLIERAVALARDDVLADEQYADWPTRARDEYRRRTLETAIAGAQAALACGELDRAVALARMATVRDPLAEQAWQALIEAQLRAGHRTEAIRAYQTCRSELDRELGLEPSKQTQALLRRALTTLDNETDRGPELAAS